MATDLVINFDEPREKALILDKMRNLRGMNRIEIKAYRKRRSDPQNRLYWGLVVSELADHLRGHGNEYTDEQVHELLAGELLQITRVDHGTGEILGTAIRSTASLDTQEFNEYIERCVQWAAERCGLVIKLPGEDWKSWCGESQAVPA